MNSPSPFIPREHWRPLGLVRLSVIENDTGMNSMNAVHFMKTMLDLLTRLVEMRQCCERVRDNSQLTDGEKAAANCLKNLVRERLAAPVLVTYDRMKETEAELVECPEVFAMAVLVSAYRSSSPAKRKKLPAHFATPPRAAAPTGHNGTTRISQNGVQ